MRQGNTPSANLQRSSDGTRLRRLTMRRLTLLGVRIALSFCLALSSLAHAQTEPPGMNVTAIGLNPLTGSLYTSSSATGDVIFRRGAAGSSATTYIVGMSPSALAIDSAADTLYVTRRDTNVETVLQNGSRNFVNIGSGSIAVATNPVTHRTYMANLNQGTLSVIQGTANIVTITVGLNPSAVAVNAVTNTVYVCNQGGGTLSIIDGATNTVKSTIPVGNGPVAVAVNPITNLAYVVAQTDGTLLVLDGATNQIVRSVQVGSGPFKVGVNSVTNTVYILNGTSASMTVLNGATNTITTTIPAGSQPGGLTLNPLTNTIYVTDVKNNSLLVFDGSTNTLIQTLGAGSKAGAVVVNPLNGLIYVTGQDGDNLAVLRATPETVSATRNVGEGPADLAINPVSGTVYVANAFGNSVSVLNGADGTVLGTVPVGSGPSAVRVDPVTNTAYVTNSAGTTVSAIDGSTNTVSATIPVGQMPADLAVNPLAGLVYAVNNSGSVSVINEQTRTVTATIPVGANPNRIALSLATNTLYVPNYGANTVSVIDGATNTVVATLPVGSGPAPIAIDERTNQIYVVNLAGNSVSVIDGQSRTVTATIPVGNAPRSLAVNPVTNKIYVANLNDGTVSVIDGASNAVTATLSVGLTPYGIGVNVLSNTIYVASQGNGSVAVIDGTQNVVSQVAVGRGPASIAVNSVTGNVYVGNEVGNTVSVLARGSVQPIPVTYAIGGAVTGDTLASAPVFKTQSPTPQFTGTITTSFSASAAYSSGAPAANPPVTQVVYSVDGVAPWTSVSATDSGTPGQFTFSLPPTSLGMHTLYMFGAYGSVVSTSGSGNLITVPEIGNIASILFLVAADPTSIAVSTTTNPVLVNTSTPFTATVSPATVTGTLTFSDTLNGTTSSLGTGTLVSGSATVNATFTGKGTHTITVSYAGGGNYLPSVGTLNVPVYAPAQATLHLALRPATINYGDASTLTATVTDTSSGHQLAGNVTFYDTTNGSTQSIGTTALSGNSAVRSFKPNQVGSHNITAQYQPVDATVDTGSMDAATLSVNQLPSSLTWQPLTFKIYTGTLLDATILNAVSSVPASIAYTATSAGTTVPASLGSLLPAAQYSLTATSSPNSSIYSGASSSIAFTVQNMNLFVGYPQGSVSSFYNNGTVQSAPVAAGGLAVATGDGGAVWSLDLSGYSVSKFTDAGTLSGTYNLTDTRTARALAVDGQGTVWIASGSGVISALTRDGAPAQTAPIGTAAHLNQPSSISVDGAGSLWLANAGSSTVTEIIGVAAPVSTPIVQTALDGTVANRP